MKEVIEGKLIPPPLPEPYVARSRLEDRLAGLIEDRRVVVVTATAGAGKTTAVAAAASRSDRPVAWLTLGRSDTAPGRLVAYLEAALSRQVPAANGVGEHALSAGVPHAEAAGLLAESIENRPLLLVIDQLEEIDDAPAAREVMASFLRFVPVSARVVLVSRRSVAPEILAPLLVRGDAATLGEVDLALTTAETQAMLIRLGEPELDADAIAQSTGGWLAGVLFEVWRMADHVNGTGGEEDALHGYLASEIVGRLQAPEREFLIGTAVLSEVTQPRAVALGYPDAGARLAALRATRLPASWRANSGALLYHPRFREYLLDRLERTPPSRVRQIRLAHARLLVTEGHLEDAVEEFLRAGIIDRESRAVAERVVGALIARADFELAERWLEAFAAAPATDPAAFAIAELLIALGTPDFARGLRQLETLQERGEHDDLARQSPLAAALMAWVYALYFRTTEAEHVLELARDDPAVEAVSYAVALVAGGPPPDRPQLTGGPLDALILSTDVFRGRLAGVLQPSGTPWIDAVAGSREIWARRALGETERALELYEQMRALGHDTLQVLCWAAPEVLIDAGRADEARATIARARQLILQAGSSPFFEAFSALVEAKLELRLTGDLPAARAVLERLDAMELAASPLIGAALNTWYGLLLLRESDDEQALARLRQAVDWMVTGSQLLELPTAAIYLAEAEWRTGHEERADQAADLALDAAHRMGSRHVLLQAVADFPAVLSRRIDAERHAGSRWHELGRALIAQGADVAAAVHHTVRMAEFGRLALVVDGETVRPRISKSYELLAFLGTRPQRCAERAELLDALFSSRTDSSARSYLRQATLWLRSCLPEGVLNVSRAGRVQLEPDAEIELESARFERELAAAARLDGEARVAATQRALARAQAGEYLPGLGTPWVNERREHLAALAVSARYEVAELVLALGRLGEAQRYSDEVLRGDPFHEPAWRLKMRIADAFGDEAGVMRAYRQCEEALGKVGTHPSPSTRALLERLRR